MCEESSTDMVLRILKWHLEPDLRALVFLKAEGSWSGTLEVTS